MATTYVALDLETTGLDPQQDEIIEVGAVKFTETGVLDTFHALVKPRRPLPYAIQLLTGITSQDLQDAPPFAVIAGDLLLFLGQHHLVGQNASFDLSFLARAGLELRNPVFDTLELSKILLPRLPERNLTALAGHLGVSYPVKHRAVADATATRAVFLALWQRAQALDPRVLAPLSNLGASTGWALGGLFQEALLERMAGATSAPQAPAPPTAQAPPSPLAADTQPTAEPALAAGLPAVAGQSQRPLDVDLLSRIIGPAGPLARALSGFEHRQEQVDMLQAVAEAFNAREHLLVEAGTGTGKSLAYLLPAVCQAAQNNTRVVISTNTIGLQEQIVTKDIPLLLGALSAAQEETPAQGAPSVDRLRVAQLKGRSNYLCARRWSAFTSGGLGDLDPTFLARLVVWAATTETGDRAELNLNNTDLAAWSRVSAQSENCPATQCLMFRSGGCFLQQARQRAAAAHLVVVNHALLVSDLITDNKVLPEHDYLVVDEAHHLEDVATDQLGFRAGPWDFYGLLDRLSQESAGRRRQGFLPSLEAAAQSGGPLFATQSALLEQSSALQGRLASVRSRTEGLFATLAQYLREHGEGSAEYGRRVRLTGGARRQPLWSQVEQAWEDLRLTLQDVGDRLERLVTGMEALSGGQLEHYDDLLAEAAGLLFTCQELLQQGNAVIARADPAWVCWLAATGQSEGVGLYAAPLEVGTVLQRDLFAKKASVVLTSATLQTSGSFDYLRRRLGLEGPRELAVGSPFPYRSAALVLVPQDIPDPQRPGHARALEQALADLCEASQGRALVLFTSYAGLHAAHRALTQLLEPKGIRVLAQGVSGSAHQLLERLRQDAGTVLLGTSTFWEGVDVVGEALSLLVITRLPFSVPTEPVFAARSEGFEDPFREYAVPQAVLRFRQGFGRLIRSKTDRGVAVVLDPRVANKSYGAAFLDSLPPVTLKRCTLREASRLLASWLQPPTG